MKEIDIQVPEAQRVPHKMNPRRSTLQHVISKVLKVKDRILKAREKQKVTYKEKPIRSSADSSAETLQARRVWHDTFKVLKGIT